MKIYKVEFLEYTNALEDTVCNRKTDEYLDCKDMLIREIDLDYYKNFGRGFKSLIFVGNLRVTK